jgi:hypothetical protein
METPIESYRFIVRSKDRISGTANNFTVQFPQALPATFQDFYVKLSAISLGTYPAIGALNTLTTTPYTITTYNTDSFPAIYNTTYKNQSAVTVYAPAQVSQAMGFDTSSSIDLCVGFHYSASVDSESLKYQTDPTGVAGATNYPAANKKSSDITLTNIPYSRGEQMRTVSLFFDRPWVKIKNPNNLGQLSVKLFSDKGFPLALKGFFPYNPSDTSTYYSASIDDWSMELLFVPVQPGGGYHGFRP